MGGLVVADQNKREDQDHHHHSSSESQYQKGVKHLCENGITRVPNKYVLPVPDRPNLREQQNATTTTAYGNHIKLPIIDFAQLQGPERSQVLKTLSKACEEYGFFQVTNHGIPTDVIRNMIDVSKRFFELPYEERAKYMTPDLSSPVRYGTSFNQTKDGVFCWRDFLKLVCNPLPDILPLWPSFPLDLRQSAVTYSEETKSLFAMLMKAILESLGLVGRDKEEDGDDDEDEINKEILKQFQDGSQLMVINCFPPCPEPELTLGMPPHSDYGSLTLVLQDEVEGLQIQYQGQWFTVQPLPNSFVVNVGDHLEIFSNGRYKSVLHRVLVNSTRSRLSVASLHSLPFETVVRPAPKLINESNPRRYKDTDFAAFLKYLSSCEPKKKNFLESRKLTTHNHSSVSRSSKSKNESK
ncbi:probable 2-oxoglutarate-dependent dioxygenase SLC1 [Telopea speciosissima]|uniref:probable 2-oxoglutarate-dependent dioxygenase SLC1 n=1 Tax=Telopea speciosissima TaxID=54955 RepID=UPI001CC7ADEB|nr:probable 2-oxoglutarate-dependent dioxygenase SLC1 [Telopea speciosissima]